MKTNSSSLFMTAALALSAAASSANAMTFRYFRPYSVFAEGKITSTTPAEFTRFIGADFVREVVFDSPGGNLAAGLELGRRIRAAGLTTSVGRPDARGFVSALDPFPDPGLCASACTFAFIGGISREVPHGSQFAVHRFSPEGKLDDPLQEAQIEAGVLVQYIAEMGVDSAMYTEMTKGGPDERTANYLDPATLKRLNIVTNRVVRATPSADLSRLDLTDGDTGGAFTYGELTFWCNRPPSETPRFLVRAYFSAYLARTNSAYSFVWVSKPGGSMTIPSSAYRLPSQQQKGKIAVDIEVTRPLLDEWILKARSIGVELTQPGDSLPNRDEISALPSNFAGAVEQMAKACH